MAKSLHSLALLVPGHARIRPGKQRASSSLGQAGPSPMYTYAGERTFGREASDGTSSEVVLSTQRGRTHPGGLFGAPRNALPGSLRPLMSRYMTEGCHQTSATPSSTPPCQACVACSVRQVRNIFDKINLGTHGRNNELSSRQL